MKTIYLYGFNRNHELITYQFITEDDFCMRKIKSAIDFMNGKSTDICEIIAIDNTKPVREAFRELNEKKLAAKFERDYEFWDFITRLGVKVYEKG